MNSRYLQSLMEVTSYCLEILSHGGLPHNLSKDEFFAGISKPRNIALMKIDSFATHFVK